MRQETLSPSYRKTRFRLADIDHLIQFLVATGSIGRANVESLEFYWESAADLDTDQATGVNFDIKSLALPHIHVPRCVQLLKQCARLKYLRVYFDDFLLLEAPPETYINDPGIRELCSLQGLEKVQVYGLSDDPIEDCPLAQLLKGSIEASRDINSASR